MSSVYLRAFWLIVLLFPLSSKLHAAPDQCNDILKGGVFDTLIRTSSLTADEQTFEWLKTVTWKEFSEKQDAGLKLTLPVDGLPIPVNADGKYSHEQFQKFAEARDQGQVRMFRQDEFESLVSRSASDVIAKRWAHCMNQKAQGFGLNCWLDDDEQPNGTIYFHAIYRPDVKTATEPVIRKGGFTLVNGTLVDKPNPLVFPNKVPFGGTGATIKRKGKLRVAVTLQTSKSPCHVAAEEIREEPPQSLALNIQVFTKTSSIQAHPTDSVPLPTGYKLIGGGALANWQTNGSLLISTYPSGNSWIAQSKDHAWDGKGGAEPTTITVFAIGLYDPHEEWDVLVKSAVSPAVAQVPSSAVATLPPGYTLTGGGALASPDNPGILLTASFPVSTKSWQANAKDHGVLANGNLTAFVIGIKPKKLGAATSRIWSTVSQVAPHPVGAASVDPGWFLMGGGARTNCAPVGSLLTASYPIDSQTWRGEAKDHAVGCPSSITVYAIGLRPTPGSSYASTEVQYASPSFQGRYSLVGDSTAPRFVGVTGKRTMRYVSRRADTPTTIALRFYGKPDRRRILEANLAQIKDPKHIQPGTVLLIPQ